MNIEPDIIRVDSAPLPNERPSRDRRLYQDMKELTGYWWDNDSIARHNHLVMENGKDFHLMTDEEYYNADC